MNYARYRPASAKILLAGPDLAGRLACGLGGVEDLEALGEPAVGQPGLLSQPGQPGPQQLGEVIPVTDLA